MHIKIKWSCHRTDEKTTTALKQEKEEAFMTVAAFYQTYNWKKRKQALPMH
jgi:hypothetical protein